MILTVLAIWSFLRQPAQLPHNSGGCPQLFEGLVRPTLWGVYPLLTAGAAYHAYLAALDLGSLASGGAVSLAAAAAISLRDVPLFPRRRAALSPR